MVMDATQAQQPPPHSVGREFVRQYYTLLNKAPNHLHRFYNNNSSFIHGESNLVVGQKNIYNEIQQLKFHDCHAKISQVDAQATLGNGVVVQVTGELSNNGQPMRRFTQTFVLAAQAPKKYYVHNDIFRYQDLYSDEENEGECRAEQDEEHDPQVPVGQVMGQTALIVDQQLPIVVSEQPHQPIQHIPTQGISGITCAGGAVINQQAPTVYYSMPASGGRPLTVLPPMPLGATFANIAGVTSQHSQTVTGNTNNASQLNGVIAPEDMINVTPPKIQMVSPSNHASSTGVAQSTGNVPVANVAHMGGQISNIPVVTVAQNTSGMMPTYQQATFIPTHILQQQQPQAPQQQQAQSKSNINQDQNHTQQQQQQQPLKQQSSQTLTTHVNLAEVGNGVSNNNLASNSNSTIASELPRHNATIASVVAGGQVTSVSTSVVPESVSNKVVEDFKTINEQQQQEKYETAKQQQNEPKTYANLFKSTSSSPNNFINTAMHQQHQMQQHQPHHPQHSTNNTYQPNTTISSTTYTQSGMGTYGNRNNDGSVRQDNQRQAKIYSKDFDQRRTSNAQHFGDNQQLFLGNIPHHASEEELKALFARFGNVLDLRILSKSSGKMPPGVRNPLNYGFITYEDSESVQNCLAHCPLYFPENSPERQKLNVEEKRPRARLNDMSQRQTMNSGGGGMNNINNHRGPQSRSLSNSGNGGGNIMRGGANANNNMSRGASNGPRMGPGNYNRNENRNENRNSNNGGGSQMRSGGSGGSGSGGNNSHAQSSGNNYSVRR